MADAESKNVTITLSLDSSKFDKSIEKSRKSLDALKDFNVSDSIIKALKDSLNQASELFKNNSNTLNKDIQKIVREYNNTLTSTISKLDEPGKAIVSMLSKTGEEIAKSSSASVSSIVYANIKELKKAYEDLNMALTNHRGYKANIDSREDIHKQLKNEGLLKQAKEEIFKNYGIKDFSDVIKNNNLLKQGIELFNNASEKFKNNILSQTKNYNNAITRKLSNGRQSFSLKNDLNNSVVRTIAHKTIVDKINREIIGSDTYKKAYDEVVKQRTSQWESEYKLLQEQIAKLKETITNLNNSLRNGTKKEEITDKKTDNKEKSSHISDSTEALKQFNSEIRITGEVCFKAVPNILGVANAIRVLTEMCNRFNGGGNTTPPHNYNNGPIQPEWNRAGSFPYTHREDGKSYKNYGPSEQAFTSLVTRSHSNLFNPEAAKNWVTLANSVSKNMKDYFNALQGLNIQDYDTQLKNKYINERKQRQAKEHEYDRYLKQFSDELNSMSIKKQKEIAKETFSTLSKEEIKEARRALYGNARQGTQYEVGSYWWPRKQAEDKVYPTNISQNNKEAESKISSNLNNAATNLNNAANKLSDAVNKLNGQTQHNTITGFAQDSTHNNGPKAMFNGHPTKSEYTFGQSSYTTYDHISNNGSKKMPSLEEYLASKGLDKAPIGIGRQEEWLKDIEKAKAEYNAMCRAVATNLKDMSKGDKDYLRERINEAEERNRLQIKSDTELVKERMAEEKLRQKGNAEYIKEQVKEREKEVKEAEKAKAQIEKLLLDINNLRSMVSKTSGIGSQMKPLSLDTWTGRMSAREDSLLSSLKNLGYDTSGLGKAFGNISSWESYMDTVKKNSDYYMREMQSKINGFYDKYNAFLNYPKQSDKFITKQQLDDFKYKEEQLLKGTGITGKLGDKDLGKLNELWRPEAVRNALQQLTLLKDKYDSFMSAPMKNNKASEFESLYNSIKKVLDELDKAGLSQRAFSLGILKTPNDVKAMIDEAKKIADQTKALEQEYIKEFNTLEQKWKHALTSSKGMNIDKSLDILSRQTELIRNNPNINFGSTPITYDTINELDLKYKANLYNEIAKQVEKIRNMWKDVYKAEETTKKPMSEGDFNARIARINAEEKALHNLVFEYQKYYYMEKVAKLGVMQRSDSNYTVYNKHHGDSTTYDYDTHKKNTLKTTSGNSNRQDTRNSLFAKYKNLYEQYNEIQKIANVTGKEVSLANYQTFFYKFKSLTEQMEAIGLHTSPLRYSYHNMQTPSEYAQYLKDNTKNNNDIGKKSKDEERLQTYKQAYDQIISKQQEMLRTGEYLNSRTVEKLTKEANAYANAYNELANLMRSKGMQVDHLKTTPFEAYSANGGYYTVDYYNENTARANANRARENQKDYFERMLHGANYYSGSGITSYSDELSKLKALQEGNLMSWFQTGNKQSMQSFMNMTANVTKLTNEYERLNRVLGTTSTTWDTLTKKMAHHLTWMTSGMFVGAPIMAVQQTFDTLKEIEFAMAGIQQVMPSIETDMAAAKQEARDLIGIASRYGESVGGVMESAKSIGRMYGKDIDEKGNKVAGVGATNTNIMTAQAAKMAVADAFSMEEAFRGLESAMAQWNLQTENSNELMVRTNRLLETWTITAHNGAASGRDIANAIEVAGTAAAQAGMSFEFFNALLATGVRQTARSGSEIGTAIKSMTVSLESDKARKQLEAWGIEYLEKDKEGNERVRNIEDLILDISAKVSTTDKDTHALLTALSGGRRILAAYHGNMVS